MKAAVHLLAAITLVACEKPPTAEQPPTVVSATVDGRTIRATVVGNAKIQQEGNTAVVTTDKHKFVVERERFTIDGEELLKLRPKVDFVEFYLNDQGYFTMNADRAGVASKQLPSANPYKKQQVGGATRLDERIIHYSIFGNAVISPEGDTAVIKTDQYTIVVERERVTLAGKEVAQLAPATKDVRINLTEDRQFTVQADGTTLVSKPVADILKETK